MWDACHWRHSCGPELGPQHPCRRAAQSGAFTADLLVGDTGITAPLEWRMAELTVLHPPLDDGSQPAGPAPRAMEELLR